MLKLGPKAKGKTKVKRKQAKAKEKGKAKGKTKRMLQQSVRFALPAIVPRLRKC